MATYSVLVSTADGTVPFVTGASRESLARFRDVLKRMASGATRVGTNTITVRNSAVAASAVVTCATVVNANTVTINGQALTATQHNARQTLTCVSAIATNTVVINGYSFVGQASAATLGTLFFDTRTSDTACATSIAAQINSYEPLSTICTATSAAGVVTVRALTAGTGGNAITTTTTGGTITAGAGTLAGGATVANNQFDFGGSDTQTAAALCAALSASTTSIVSGHVTGTNVLGVVTISARQPGVSGNAISIATSGATLAITGGVSRLAGGTETLLTQLAF